MLEDFEIGWWPGLISWEVWLPSSCYRRCVNSWHNKTLFRHLVTWLYVHATRETDVLSNSCCSVRVMLQVTLSSYMTILRLSSIAKQNITLASDMPILEKFPSNFVGQSPQRTKIFCGISWTTFKAIAVERLCFRHHQARAFGQTKVSKTTMEVPSHAIIKYKVVHNDASIFGEVAFCIARNTFAIFFVGLFYRHVISFAWCKFFVRHHHFASAAQYFIMCSIQPPWREIAVGAQWSVVWIARW